MNNLAIQAEIKPELKRTLTEQERTEFQESCKIISENVRIGNKATAKIIDELDNILRKKLWQEDYLSEKEFIHAVWGTQVSSAHRKIKDRKTYLYLITKADDEQEIETLMNMNEFVFREMRRISVSSESNLPKNKESDEDYYERLDAKHLEEFESICNFWKWAYPKIKFFKETNSKGRLPGGGVRITAGDILEAAKVLGDLLQGEPDKAIVEIEGKTISVKEIAESSNEETSGDVLEALTTLAVSENLTQKLKRHRQHIRDSLETKYEYDEYHGQFDLDSSGRFVIKTQYGSVDLTSHQASLIGKEGTVIFRTVIKPIED